MKKFFLFFVFLFSLFFFNSSLLTNNVLAEGEFSTDYEVTYTLRENGITEVKNRIVLTNLFSNLYATSYSIKLHNLTPKNIKVYDDSGLNYQPTITEAEGVTSILVNFPDTVVGKNKSRIFYIVYEETSFAVKTGEVWEVTIPKISSENEFTSYSLNLIVPKNIGNEAYISPSPRSINHNDDFYVYNFSKDLVLKSGIVAGFGQFQVFSFTLHYHLENPLNKLAETEITLPPDTAYQKMYYSNITPRPNSMYMDNDGNWMAKYTLKARERIDVTAVGHVQIFAGLRPFPKPTNEVLNKNMFQNTYWEADNPQIIALARELKTPKNIYDYVAKTLNYDYERVRPNVERYGALKALNNPQNAICMEFTDLFIAIARAAGIPAREINGYAYTENPEIQPLSLVNDVLHAWPEYYDSQRGAWIPIDPTWASTTGGIDYFNKLDLRHFAFVIHGEDSTKPYPAGSYKLGANPQKDVFVSFGSLPQEKITKPEIKAFLEGWVPLLPNRLDVEILNSGPSAIYNLVPKVYFDDKEVFTVETLEVLLPFQTHKTYIDIPFSFLGRGTPEIVKVELDGEVVMVKTGKTQVIIYNLLFIFIVSIVILVTILARMGRLEFVKIPSKWLFLKKNS